MSARKGASLIVGLAAIVALVIPQVTFGATAATAASCSSSPSKANCDGLWPDEAGCATNASTAESNYVFAADNKLVGYIQVRYSPTCRTAWARILTLNADTNVIARIIRNSDGATYSCYTDNYSASLGYHSCYSAQVYDGGVTSKAWGTAAAYGIGVGVGQTASY